MARTQKRAASAVSKSTPKTNTDPIYTTKQGRWRLSVFERVNEHGSWMNASIQRAFKNRKGEFEYTSQFGEADLTDLEELLAKARLVMEEGPEALRQDEIAELEAKLAELKSAQK